MVVVEEEDHPKMVEEAEEDRHHKMMEEMEVEEDHKMVVIKDHQEMEAQQ